MPAPIVTTQSASAEEVRALFEEASGSWLNGDDAIHIKPGDWYWAQRNGPPRILRCKVNNHEQGWVIATTNAYPYSAAECFRLKADVHVGCVEALAARTDAEFEGWSQAWRAQPLN